MNELSYVCRRCNGKTIKFLITQDKQFCYCTECDKDSPILDEMKKYHHEIASTIIYGGGGEDITPSQH